MIFISGRPVILKAGNVMVAINDTLLKQESAVLRRRLSSTWTGY